MDRRGKDVVRTLFEFYSEYPERMPVTTYSKYKEKGIIVIADFIAGMTDRYALDRYSSLIEFA